MRRQFVYVLKMASDRRHGPSQRADRRGRGPLPASSPPRAFKQSCPTYSLHRWRSQLDTGNSLNLFQTHRSGRQPRVFYQCCCDVKQRNETREQEDETVRRQESEHA